MTKHILHNILQNKSLQSALALLGIAGVTAALAPFQTHINSATFALALLLVVLFAATLWGSRPALLAALLAVLCLNFFFLPPVGAFTIADPENWVALAVFFITAITAGQLSAAARRRAEEAEAGRREIGRLYSELQNAFERASHAEALRQSEKLKSALLGAVWGGNYTEQTEYLRVFISQLRKKIEVDPAKPRYILTEPWTGYRFDPTVK